MIITVTDLRKRLNKYLESINDGEFIYVLNETHRSRSLVLLNPDTLREILDNPKSSMKALLSLQEMNERASERVRNRSKHLNE